MSDFRGKTFEQAEGYLAAGRYKTWRPMARYSTFMIRLDGDNIAIVVHSTSVVVYHRDGTITLNSGGWKTQLTQSTIDEYTPIRVRNTYDPKNPGWIVGWTGEHKPARVQKCRSCKGKGGSVARRQCSGAPSWNCGEVVNVCNGGAMSSPYGYDEDGKWGRWFESVFTPCEHGAQFTSRHRLKLCEHGQRNAHPIGDPVGITCHRCKGEGIVDYGSQPIPLVWASDSESPIKIDAEGNVLTFNADVIKAPQRPYILKPKPSFHGGYIDQSAMHLYMQQKYGKDALLSIGGELQTALTNVLPDLDKRVACPLIHCASTGSISQVVVHLNDDHQWKRPKIADWLDTLDADLRFRA